MATFTAGQTLTLSLDYDDYITWSGQGTATVTPASGSVTTTYLTGNQTLGPYKQYVTISIVTSSVGSYTQNSQPAVDTPAVYNVDSQGNVNGLVGPNGAVITLGMNGADFLTSFIVSGIALPSVGTNAAASVTAGVVYVFGTRVVFAGSVPGFANGDNYLDLSSTGVLTLQTVAHLAAAPAVAVNSIRLGFVYCAAGSVVSNTTGQKDSLGNWMGNRTGRIACQLHSIPAAAIANGHNPYLWDATRVTTEVLDNYPCHSLTVNPSRITAPVSGLFNVSAGLQWSSGTIGEMRIYKNGSPLTGIPEAYFGANTTTLYGAIAGFVLLNAGDYIELHTDATTGPFIFNATMSAVLM